MARRNQQLKDAFYARDTNLPRPRKLSREFVVAQLAEEFFLSVSTVEGILYRAGKGIYK
jgi:7,8-dihydro-6-hydroxymethylpterin-pyrophosphokinase